MINPQLRLFTFKICHCSKAPTTKNTKSSSNATEIWTHNLFMHPLLPPSSGKGHRSIWSTVYSRHLFYLLSLRITVPWQVIHTVKEQRRVKGNNDKDVWRGEGNAQRIEAQHWDLSYISLNMSKSTFFYHPRGKHLFSFYFYFLLDLFLYIHTFIHSVAIGV